MLIEQDGAYGYALANGLALLYTTNGHQRPPRSLQADPAVHTGAGMKGVTKQIPEVSGNTCTNKMPQIVCVCPVEIHYP